MSENIRSEQFKSLILHSIIKEVNTNRHVAHEFLNLLSNPEIFLAYKNFENIKRECTKCYLVELRFAFAISPAKVVLHHGSI